MGLISLSEAKAYRNITGTQHDSELTRLIEVASTLYETFVGPVKEITGKIDYFSTKSGQRRLFLSTTPVSVVTSIYDDVTRVYGADTLLIANKDYVLEDAALGIVRLDLWSFTDGVNNVKVTYNGGVATATDDVKQDMIEMVWRMRNKGDLNLIGVNSRSIADGSINVYAMGVEDILKAAAKRRGTLMSRVLA